jgi:Leucine-rich repeat (LRR) protein
MYSDARLLQRYALATFYYSTHGEDWFFQTNWLSDMDECFWYSRSPQSPCDIDGGLQNLELDYNNINGELPPELGLLSNSLERIVLRGGPNSVTSGTLPSELGYLTKMANFFIRGNHFAGSLPYQLGRWTALEQFDISGNRFTGTLPPSLFANAVQLSFIDISNNRFTGSLPTQVGNMEKCQRFIIENNMITGAIPTEIGDLRRLQSFYGGSNMLSSLPSEIGRLTFLDTLALQQNTFMGTIPSELSRIQRLLILDLSSNSLSGPIPSRMSKTTDFMKFPTSSNTKLSPSFRTW